MSWDINFSTADAVMGSKASVREKFLTACEEILGKPVERQGPTEQLIHDSFYYEALFEGPKHATESLSLAFKIREGDPSSDDAHPAWSFIRQIIQHTGWQAVDTHSGERVT